MRKWLVIVVTLCLILGGSPAPSLAHDGAMQHQIVMEQERSVVSLESVSDGSEHEPVEERIDPQVLEQFNEQEYVSYVVRLKEQVDVEQVAKQGALSSAIRKESPVQSKLTIRSYLLQTLMDTAERTQQRIIDDLEQGKLIGNVLDYQSFFILNVLAITSDRHTMERLSTHREVERIMPNQTYSLDVEWSEDDLSFNNDQTLLATETETPWNLNQINVPEVWELGIDGTGVVVANMDSGVDLQHPALQRKWRGYDATGQIQQPELSWFDATAERRVLPYDGNGHGTHVMGTIVGSEAEGSNQIGVAPQAKWIAARVFDTEGVATDTGILAAGEWILAPRDAQGRVHPDLAPDVVNNSWGNVVAGKNEFFQEIVRAWRAADIFPVFSVGNTSVYNDGGLGSATPPGNYPESFAVGAVDMNNRLASFSLWGPSPYGEIKPEVVAPGVNVRSAIPNGKYALLNGTSMASPHTAGVAALAVQANPAITVEEMEQILIDSAVPLTDQRFPQAPNYGYGWGQVNALNAVSMIQEGLQIVRGQVTIAGEDTDFPIIEHQPIALTFNVFDQDIYVRVRDEVGVVQVHLLVRPQGEEFWEELPMHLSSGNYADGIYQGQIPVELLSLAGVEYRIRAIDFGANVSETEPFELEVSEGVQLGYIQDFEENINGFDFGGDEGIWEWGVPTSGPGQAATGTKVLATKLDGNYPVGTQSYFVMPLIDLRAGEDTLLSFTHWFKPGNWMGAIFDRADVFVGTESSGFQFDFARTFNWSTNGWTTDYLDLSPYKGDRLFVIFQLSGLNGSAEGWYIDSLSLIETDEQPPEAPHISVRTNTPGRVIVEWPQAPQGEIKEYVIYRSTDVDGQFTEVGISTTRNYGETPTPQKGTYSYMVRAKTYSNVLSSPSNVVHWTFTAGEELFSDDFEGSDLGWTVVGEQNDWERGVPNPGYSQGPRGAVSGSQVWATNLSSGYAGNTNHLLVSPVIDLSTAEQATLYFQHWYDIGDADRMFVEISKDAGATWDRLTEYPKVPSDSMHPRRFWYLNEVGLGPEYIGHEVQIRFRLQSGNASYSAGWYIDDVEVRETPPVKSGSKEEVSEWSGPIKLGGASELNEVSETRETRETRETKETRETRETGGINETRESSEPLIPNRLSVQKASPLRQQVEASALVDQHNTVLPAPATITMLETNRSTRTDLGTGKYELKHPLGTYTLRVEAYGYHTIDQEVTIEEQMEAHFDFYLEPLATGNISGLVKDGRGQPIQGATLRVLEDTRLSPVRTNATGEYVISDVFEGEYTLLVSALGYRSVKSSLTVLADQSVTKDIQLLSFSGSPDELVYDSGVADNALAFRTAGNAFAVRMTIEEQAQITGAQFYFWPEGWPEPGGTEFEYAVYDASGPDGLPGQIVSGPYQGVAQRDGTWTEVEFLNPLIVNGDFYMVYIQSGSFPDVPALGVDRSGSSFNRSWRMEEGTWRQAAAADGNFMIRGKITTLLDAPVILAPSHEQSVEEAQIMVEGTYHQEGATISIFNNGEIVGIGIVENGSFTISVDLVSGVNQLYAVAEKDGKYSQPSASITVIYTPKTRLPIIPKPPDYWNPVPIEPKDIKE